MSPTEIAKKLLRAARPESWAHIPGPSHSASDLSLGVLFSKNEPDGFRVHSFANNNQKECRAYVLSILSDNPISNWHMTDKSDGSLDRTDRALAAISIWNDAAAPTGTMVDIYLTARSCPLSTSVIQADALRFHSKCPFRQHRLPVMVALIRAVVSDVPIGIHRTALEDNGTGKRDMPEGASAKMMLGLTKGGAVKLEPAAPVMGIAEGIETALSARAIFEVPVWAVLSAGGVSNFPVIAGIQQLIIFADHDTAGITAAHSCAERYSRAGIAAEIRYPTKAGQDWNSYLQETVK